MAQLNLTLDENEILRLLSADSPEVMRSLLEAALNQFLKIESAQQLKAEPWERTSERTDSRNGSRTRPLSTRLGTITLQVPRHRNVPFKSLLLENYKRSEAALVSVMAEMVVAGISTAKVARVFEELCGTTPSKQAVSEACKTLDGPIAAFCSRPLGQPYPFVVMDATYFKVRENHRVVSKALLVALGYKPSGTRELLGFEVAESESQESWSQFLARLKARGLYGVRLVTSDGAASIRVALAQEMPEVAWQRCQAHFRRDVCDKAPKKFRVGLGQELTEMFRAPSLKAAQAKCDQILADYSSVAPQAMKCLDAGFADALVVMELPACMWKMLRTSNVLERINRELKRRSNVVSVFPNRQSLLRLMGSVLLEENDAWQAARVCFSKKSLQVLESKAPRLLEIAKVQREALVA